MTECPCDICYPLGHFCDSGLPEIATDIYKMFAEFQNGP